MRSIWTGAINFGMVTIPVKMYTATEQKDVSFHQVHREDGGRVRYKRVCTVDGEEVPYAATVVIERYEETFRGPSLPAGDFADAERRRLEARDVADALGLPIGNAVDFWTEASLFSATGLTALVYGPGDIAQAHSADEWVALEQLATAATTYRHLLER